jgi:hypothetical protein
MRFSKIKCLYLIYLLYYTYMSDTKQQLDRQKFTAQTFNIANLGGDIQDRI